MNSRRITRISASNQNIQLTPTQENIGRRRQRDETEQSNERALPKPKIKKKENPSNSPSVFKVTNANIRDSIKKYFKEPGSLPRIGEWDVSEVTNMKNLFGADFNKKHFNIDISGFNEDISNWNVSKVTDMSKMFANTSFNQDISKWNVSSVQHFDSMFARAISFNKPLNSWNTSSAISLSHMFYKAKKFNQPLHDWNVSKVETMAGLFCEAHVFNQSLNDWDVSHVMTMENLFDHATAFNQPLDQWDVSRVEEMNDMFMNAASFNQTLNNWNVTNVTDFGGMFCDAIAFNQPLNNWNVRRATDMIEMFENARSFDQNISNWEILTRRTDDMFLNSAIREEFKPRLIQRQVPTQPLPLQGIAFQVHNAFSSIDFNKLFNIINSGTIDKYTSSQNFKQYMKNELKTILDNYNESDKNSLITKFNKLTGKIDVIKYTLPEFTPFGENAFYTIINFIKKQDKHYQDNYIKFFINDSYSAYDSGDTTSCVTGIQERIIFALGQAGYDIDNPLYKQISEILFPLKDSQIYSFIGSCIDDNNASLIKIPDENIEGKKNIVKDCVKKQISESFPTLPVNTMDERISKLINASSDMLLNASLSGGKRKTKKKITTRITNKRIKKYTKKQIRRKRKNVTRKN